MFNTIVEATLIPSMEFESKILEVGTDLFLVPSKSFDNEVNEVIVKILDGTEEVKIGVLASKKAMIIKGETSVEILALLEAGKISKGVKISEVTSRVTKGKTGTSKTKTAYIISIPILQTEEDSSKKKEEMLKEMEAKADLEIKKIVEEKVSLGISRDIIKKTYKFMRDTVGLQKAQIVDIIKTYTKYEKSLEERIPKETIFIDSTEAVPHMIETILQKDHLSFVGSQSTGKNTCVDFLGYIFQRPVLDMSVTGRTEEDKFIGEDTLTVKDGASILSFQKYFMTLAAEKGCFLVLDEFNMVQPDVGTVLHPLTDKRAYLTIPKTGEVIKAKDNFNIFITSNEKYEGTRKLNDATQSRFTVFRFLNFDDIRPILKAECPNAPSSYIELCQTLYSMVKNASHGENAQIGDQSLSIRGYVKAINQASSGRVSFKSCLIRNVVEKNQDEDDREAVMEILESII